MASPSGDGDWIERYEALRAHALGEGGLGFTPLGLAVLRHRGVVAWMDAESRVLEPAVSRTGPCLADEAAEPDLGSARSEIVALLASTALLVASGGER